MGAQALPLPLSLLPPARRGWAMVAAVHVLCALIFGAMYSFGAFVEALQARFGAGRFSVSLVFSLTAFLYYLVGPAAGALADRFAPRRVVGAGIVLLALGFALGSTAGSLAALTAIYAVFVGLGVGLVYVPAVAVVQRWFVRQRSRASGLALAGTGLGTLVAPLLAGALLQALGWQAAMRWLALGIVVFGLMVAAVLVAQPADLGLGPDGEPAPAPGAAASAAAGLSLAQAVGTARFWWLFASILLASVGLFVALVHIAPQARGLGLPAGQAPLLIGLVGVGNVAGRLVLGGLGDRLGPQRLLLALNVALAVLHLLWLAAGSVAALGAFALLFGLAQGGCIALYPTVTAELFGTRRLGAILGALYVSVGIAALFSASAAGWLFDRTHGYALPIALSGAAALLGAACLWRAGPTSSTPLSP
ncbi:MAG: MFS transporter [Xenophilus sp.]